MPHGGPFGLGFFQNDCRSNHHQQTVTHVSHHKAVEKDEEGGHQRVGVQRAVSRQRVHIGDHVQRAGEAVVLQRYRNVGILLLLRLPQGPGAVGAAHQGFESLLLFGGQPALDGGHAARGTQPVGGFFPGQILLGTVQRQFQPIVLVCQSQNTLSGSFFLSLDAVGFLCDTVQVFSGSTLQTFPGGKGKAHAPQVIQRFFFLTLMNQKGKVDQIFILRDPG